MSATGQLKDGDPFAAGTVGATLSAECDEATLRRDAPPLVDEND